MLSWLGRVVVLLVEGVGLDSGTTVYREGKKIPERKNKTLNTWHMCKCSQDDDMTGLKGSKTSPEHK